VTYSRAMVRFKVGTARKRTDKSPERIYIWVLLSLSLSLCVSVSGELL
jgi:hypothetical protein